MNNIYINIKDVAEAKGLKSTRSLRLELNKNESKYISREIKVKGNIMSKIEINKLTNANVYLDGVNLLGRAEEVQLPQIKHKMAEHKALGMVGSAEFFAGIDKMECKIKSAKCCQIMKKTPAKKFEKESGLKPFIATMAAESNLRKTEYLKKGCNSFNSDRPASTPLGFWTEQDIYQYIKEFGVPYCSVYGDILQDSKCS